MTTPDRVMGLTKKDQKMFAIELEGEVTQPPNEPPTHGPSQNGRRLILKFIGSNKPELDRIEFRWSQTSDSFYWQQGDPQEKFPMSWTKIPQALSLIFLDYLIAGETIGPIHFTETNGGDLPTALGNAITDRFGKLHELFAERPPKEKPISRVKQIFGGKNIHGKEDGDRRIFIQSDNLPADCIEVYWPFRSRESLTAHRDILQDLARCIRESLGIKLPPEPNEPAPPPIPKTPLSSTQPSGPVAPSPIPTKVSMPDSFLESMQDIAKGVKDIAAREPSPPARQTLSLPKSFLKSVETIAGAFTQLASPKPREAEQQYLPPSEPKQIEPPSTSRPPTRQQKVAEPEDQVEASNSELETPSSPDLAFENDLPDEIPPARIHPLLLQIQNPDQLEWSDDDGLIDFGTGESDADVWHIRDACEGLLIFGAVGSGKTSGSGSSIARAYLQAGFGGIVLTAKPDEARRWMRMCQETGRADDYIHVTPNSGHKLNFLQYETQRPGERIGVTDDLITLFRCLINVSNHSKGHSSSEEFWTNTTNQLMRKLIDVLLLAGEPLTLYRMRRFIDNAPKNTKTNWRSLKVFPAILARAKENAIRGDDQDKRIFRECFEYWTQTYPAIPDITRGGFITSFSAMADTLSGRGIYEMVGTETNLTPEMILSGKVVILDIPLKGNIQGGLMVQAIWKLLFQQAVERRSDKGLSTARPAFLWEDEGHEFFSEHDVRFQPTARDIRAPHVIISQNIHNFLHLGHNEHAIMAVFAAMNTYIFHTNGDLDTNTWAANRIGQIKKLKLTTDGLLRPTKAKDITWFEREPHEVENVGKLSLREETKHALQPEDFMKLKRGGDGTCEAVILWLAHRFAANQNRNFCVLTFEQEQR
jgi:hypothetical protein